MDVSITIKIPVIQEIDSRLLVMTIAPDMVIMITFLAINFIGDIFDLPILKV